MNRVCRTNWPGISDNKGGPALPPVGAPLESYMWEEIDLISRYGRASLYWPIGDTKGITINAVKYIVEIIGFSHDDLADGSGKAGITFGLKDCLSTTYRMNSTNTNVGGWGNCAPRTTLRDTIKGQLNSDLQAVIKPVFKKASAGNQSTNINTYTDDLFMFAEIEIFGSNAYSAPGEGMQYSRFATAADRVKKVSGSAANWWLRSPYTGSAGGFGAVAAGGASSPASASDLRGLSFGFCV